MSKPNIRIDIKSCSHPVVFDNMVHVILSTSSLGMCVNVPDEHDLKTNELGIIKTLLYRAPLSPTNEIGEWEIISLGVEQLIDLFNNNEYCAMLFNKIYRLDGVHGKSIHRFCFTTTDIVRSPDKSELVSMSCEEINRLPWRLLKTVCERHENDYYFERNSYTRKPKKENHCE